ncbi:hypothetical protein [Brevibacillus reuszeri]|uniref:hypothetical protein n=1 Tax=Brevibacillus reuszeri TaxID=54915 RepID=UPI000CCC38C8|nr:hypothetical protein [Brevibacillus reuszeri]
MFSASDLKKWVLEYDAEKKAFDGFWLNLENYKIEYPLEYEEYFANFDKSQLDLKVESISISYLNYPELDYNHVKLYIPIRYQNKNIGYYEILLNFDGIVDDDFFVMY